METVNSSMHSEMRYYAFDGDQIGRRIQIFFLENNVEEIRQFSNKVSQAVSRLSQILAELGCEIVFAAGDSVLAVGSREIPLATLTACSSEITFSLGIGACPRDALIALAKAKAEGRGRIVHYEGS